jgi:hypothetical protein
MVGVVIAKVFNLEKHANTLPILVTNKNGRISTNNLPKRIAFVDYYCYTNGSCCSNSTYFKFKKESR